jgi:hypothetical protein
MKIKLTLGTAVLAVLASQAFAADPATTGALSVPANRIAGLWRTEAAVGLCGSGTTPQQIRNTLLFAAGGSVIEMPRVAPGGPRGYAIGTWSYRPLTGQYRMHLLFDVYVNGVYDGYQTVDRELLMSTDRKQIAGPVVSTRYAADGSLMFSVCGHAVSTREAG